MKGIFKIEKYLPERNAISVKFCRLHAHKSIDEYSSKIVDCSNLNMIDAETFVDSLMQHSGVRRIDKQDEREPILEENECETIVGELNIEDLVGKVIEGKVHSSRKYDLKVRKVEL